MRPVARTPARVGNGDNVHVIGAHSIHHDVWESADCELTCGEWAVSGSPDLRVRFDEIEGVGDGIEQSAAPA